ncbi:MAG: molybdopterin molybdotransferase MoeA, partial [Acidimicrobiales bacterium]
PRRVGDFVRAAGGDLAAGQVVFGAGEVLGPGHLGVLASCGLARVAVGGRPTVGVLSTGDELVEPGRELAPGQVRDSNRYILLGLLERDGYRGVDLGIAVDDEGDITARLCEGARTCDAIVTSGGVSVGEFDFVRKVLDDLGEMAWMQIAIRPGKPFAFGRIDSVPVFGLAGNPVSTMVSYELLARPGLRRRGGHREGDLFRPLQTGVAADGSLRRRPDGRVHYARVVARPGADGRLSVMSAGGQESNLLVPMVRANALAVLTDGPGVEEGEPVEVMLLG